MKAPPGPVVRMMSPLNASIVCRPPVVLLEIDVAPGRDDDVAAGPPPPNAPVLTLDCAVELEVPAGIDP